jgi:uncharacterized membrane protein YphA (DoxX/SURF4 family)
MTKSIDIINHAWVRIVTPAVNLDASLLLLRLSIAAVFLSAGRACTASKAAFARVSQETECFFPFLPAGAARKRMGGIAATIGMAMIYGGGISLLLGIEPRLGGLDVALFSLLGLRVHYVSYRFALTAAMQGDEMGIKAVSGLKASAMKNWVVVAAALMFFLVGGGKYGLGIDHTGKYLGW